MSKTRVGIRGIAGLLGKRLAREIQKHPDIEITCGIAKCDETLKRLFTEPNKHDLGWIKDIPIYLDDRRQKIREINNEQKEIEFRDASQLSHKDLKKACDILIDTAAPGSRNKKWNIEYKLFKKPVIIQSGEYPDGRLISPPLLEGAKDQGNIYRQGGCILSGLSPILGSLQPLVERIRVNILMQYDEKLRDYPTSQRINATYIRDDEASIVEEELKSLLNDKEIKVENLLQVPSLDYYTLTLYLDTKKPISGKEVREMLEDRPRLLIAPDSITSTYEIDHLLREEARDLGRSIPPVVLYGCDLNDPHPKKKDIRIRAAIYSKLIAVLPNIDTIRILGRGRDPITAMGMTDFYTRSDHYAQIRLGRMRDPYVIR